MKKRKMIEIPLWAKPSALVWVEVRDKSGIDVLEYLPAIVMETLPEKSQVKVSYENDQNEDIVSAELIHQRLAEHGIVSNLSDIPLLNDAELLKHLEIRYLRDMIYCYCGPTLIAVNPYKACPAEESSEKYESIINALLEKEVHKAPPHVWTISATAYDYLFKLRQNQAICISGESGAGKTESTKRCLAFITTLNKQRRSTNFVPIEQKIMACNPILEAFGNAKTFRNDNSSRFGKYTTLFIHKQKKSIKGASIENYLLEKSRIVKIGPEERNYHIFYAMCRFFPEDKLAQYKLSDIDSSSCSMNNYYFLNQSGVYQTAKVDDNEFYEDVCKAFLVRFMSLFLIKGFRVYKR
jgi:myosin heavy subunit